MKKPLTGIIAFLIVLLTMPLGHAAMILMEKGLGHEHVYKAALILGFIGIVFLVVGILSKKEISATLWGLFGGLFVWTGWIEFAFVYYANRFGVEPLVENGEIITKPEYLIMPSSVGFWAVFMLYYLVGTHSGCRLFLWFQKKLKIDKKIPLPKSPRNPALATFMEMIMLLWTFYMVLLFAYDPSFAGDRHPVTYFVAFASLLWSLILFVKLIKIDHLAYAIRYAVPTVIIFWNFVEILGRWNMLKEVWIEPAKYCLEMLLMLFVLVILTTTIMFRKKKIIKKY
ncbi:hypothetical protein GM418_29165 [Maribellus comscasis]|uniref:Uncharacterized protein n=1 Tax=Maribellus comscasis TaxID=2681766 RepID=A0A6I6K583_9BACT|nr:hypothetical protein [Maribellus comscasis]QGY47592.1 hypothetical protein GM418_29165 [Maribellus comscasis]